MVAVSFLPSANSRKRASASWETICVSVEHTVVYFWSIFALFFLKEWTPRNSNTNGAGRTGIYWTVFSTPSWKWNESSTQASIIIITAKRKCGIKDTFYFFYGIYTKSWYGNRKKKMEISVISPRFSRLKMWNFTSSWVRNRGDYDLGVVSLWGENKNVLPLIFPSILIETKQTE